MHVVACRACGLVYVNPMYTNAEKEAVSPQVRLLHRSRSAELTRAAALAHSAPRMRRCMDLMAPYLKPDMQVLEIGCGDGALLSLLKDCGVRPTGLDLDRDAAEAVARSLHVPVLVGTFEEMQWSGPPFDAVVLCHLIEHFFEPVQMLRKVRGLLPPGGMVFLETPNILRPKVGPRRVFSFAHNYHFSPRTLALALYEAGFRCTALREFRRDSFQIVAHAATPDDRGPRPLVQPWQDVHKAIRRHRVRYLTSLQFLWRKAPWLKDRLLYRTHRNLSDALLRQWLTAPREGRLIPAPAAAA
jgi:2-polyprenyl-3-methyl-5-hydroxy-6-metoxy-1,4-benzoquinol methylase